MKSKNTSQRKDGAVHAALHAVIRISLSLALSVPLGAAAMEPKSFATPDAAVNALLAALKADDDAALKVVFGDEHADLLISADKAANSATRAQAAAAMETYRLLEEHGNDRRVLLIGDQAWPLPIPLVQTAGRWHFATDEGVEELVNRRVGANERSAIDVLEAYVDAQKEYASRDRNGDDVLEYAQQLGSTPGKRDGLYWPADAEGGDNHRPKQEDEDDRRHRRAGGAKGNVTEDVEDGEPLFELTEEVEHA
jgi:hypothetical protein